MFCSQLPPVIKNMAFQKFSNMEQSLFTRFVRLGVPTVELDAQGRARSRYKTQLYGLISESECMNIHLFILYIDFHIFGSSSPMGILQTLKVISLHSA